MPRLSTRFHILTIIPICSLLACGSAAWSGDNSAAWPQWRGGAQNGVAEGDQYPREWSESSGVEWKKAIGGLGGSTPVIEESTAYVTAGIDGKNHLISVDVHSGDVNWSVALGKDRGKKNRKGSGSNPSAVIDDDLIFAYFRSGDLACVDKSGDIKWQTNLQESFGEDTL